MKVVGLRQGVRSKKRPLRASPLSLHNPSLDNPDSSNTKESPRLLQRITSCLVAMCDDRPARSELLATTSPRLPRELIKRLYILHALCRRVR